MAHLQTQTTPKKYVWLTGRVHILRQLGFPGNMSFNELDTKFFATKWIDLWIASWWAKRISIKQQIYVYLAICSMDLQMNMFFHQNVHFGTKQTLAKLAQKYQVQ